MQEKTKARFCEPAPAARGSQEAGFTQPSLHLFVYFFTNIGDDGVEVVDGIGGLVVVVGTDETVDVGRCGACHIRAVIQLPVMSL